MTFPTFVLSISEKKSVKVLTKWSNFKNHKTVSIKFDKDNINISFHKFANNKICILGDPIIGNTIINNESFASLLLKNKNNYKLLDKINGEFAIISLLDENKVEINSYLRNVISKKNSGYDQFAITLICKDHFLKFIDEN